MASKHPYFSIFFLFEYIKMLKFMFCAMVSHVSAQVIFNITSVQFATRDYLKVMVTTPVIGSDLDGQIAVLSLHLETDATIDTNPVSAYNFFANNLYPITAGTGVFKTGPTTWMGFSVTLNNFATGEYLVMLTFRGTPVSSGSDFYLLLSNPANYVGLGNQTQVADGKVPSVLYNYHTTMSLVSPLMRSPPPFPSHPPPLTPPPSPSHPPSHPSPFSPPPPAVPPPNHPGEITSDAVMFTLDVVSSRRRQLSVDASVLVAVQSVIASALGMYVSDVLVTSSNSTSVDVTVFVGLHPGSPTASTIAATVASLSFINTFNAAQVGVSISVVRSIVMGRAVVSAPPPSTPPFTPPLPPPSPSPLSPPPLPPSPPLPHVPLLQLDCPNDYYRFDFNGDGYATAGDCSFLENSPPSEGCLSRLQTMFGTGSLLHSCLTAFASFTTETFAPVLSA